MSERGQVSVKQRAGIGRSIPRLEDEVLLRGRGRFIDDIVLPGMAHAHMLRSPHAHAIIRSIDKSAAETAPGVVAVLTGRDLAADGIGIVDATCPVKGRDGKPIRNPARPALVVDRARFVGDGIAMIVAETEAQARDAAELIEIDWEPLPAVVDPREAVAPGAPQIWDEVPGNVTVDWALGDEAKTAAAIAGAAHVTRLTLRQNRLSVAPIEPRGAIGRYDAATGRYSVWVPSQGTTPIHLSLATQGLKTAMGDIQVLTPDVGGGFGMKNFVYPEHILVAWAAKRLGRPVKWFADRTDAFLTDAHARDHHMEAELALDAEGRFVAIRCRTLGNMGAYQTGGGPVIPTDGGSRMLANVYRIPAVFAETRCVLTNTMSVGAYRGAGKPEFCHVVERLVDAAADETGIDPAELRRRNMIAPDQFPWKTPTGLVYDSGEFARNMDDALALADRAGFPARRAESKARGRLRGFGFSAYTEPDGFKDGRVGLRFDQTGALNVTLTTCSNGQGHRTTFAQIAADRLGISPEDIHVAMGDSDVVGQGSGAGGSRVTTVQGTALFQASETIIRKGREIAALMMEASAADVEFADGRFTIAGTDRSVGIREVAKASFSPATVPPGTDLGLEAASHYVARAYSYPSGCHVCEVEIDPETGVTEIVRYSLVNDAGVVINPMLLEAQLHGGIAQGIGQALYEDCLYDRDSGQLVTASFMDYCLPRATHLPFIDYGRNETPCLTNPLGVKGVGESGTTASLPAVMNAVVDALSEFGVRDLDMPATPEKVWRAIHGRAAS